MTTLTIQPDAAAAQDTYIHQESPTLNYGVTDRIRIGEMNTGAELDRCLIKFDLSALPAAAIISSAILTLWLTGNFAANARIMRVFRQKRAWTEGTGNGAATADGATWATYDGAIAWQTAGGFGVNDCEQTDIGSFNIAAASGAGPKPITLTATTKAALDLGNGWLIKFDTESEDGHAFRSSDSGVAANRPRLVIVYTLPNPNPVAAIEPKWRQPVHIVTPPKATGGHPIPVDLVYEADLGNDKVLGGPAIPVYIDNDPEAVGGKPLPVVVMTGRKRAGGNILRVRQTN